MIGYTNASWTLKVDMAADYVCRLLNEMDRRGVKAVTPRAPSGELQDEGILDSLRLDMCNQVGPPSHAKGGTCLGVCFTSTRWTARCFGGPSMIRLWNGGIRL
jgi:hypothetical protein